MRETNITWLPITFPQSGTWPATQACALTGNQTYDLLLFRTMPNVLSHPGEDPTNSFSYINTVILLGCFLWEVDTKTGLVVPETYEQNSRRLKSKETENAKMMKQAPDTCERRRGRKTN